MKNLSALLALTACIFSVLPAQCGENAQPPQNVSQKIPLKSYLQAMGTKLNCYFTLERDNKGPHKISDFRKHSSLDGATIDDNEQITKVDELISALKKDLPQADISIARHAGDDVIVVHIADISLMTMPNYVLSRKLSIKYSGFLHSLPDALGSRLENRVSSPETMELGEMMRGDRDGQTKVSVNYDNKVVRDTLTDAVPKLQDNRILWDAEALTRDGPEVVEVKYLRPTARHREAIQTLR